MVISVKYFGKLTQDQRDKIFAKIESDNAHIPQFSEKFRCMSQFVVQKALKSKTVDLFSYDPNGQKMAIGFRIFVRGDRFYAEPWLWIVENFHNNSGIEITELDPNCLYFGIYVPPSLFETYGTSAYNVMFGNMRLLQKHSMRKISV